VRKQSSEDPDSHEAGEIVAAVPCYVVTHSMGQFIFDNSW
jgi:predicted N-acyltransferase